MELLQDSPYCEHYIGVFFAGGNTSEWYPATKLTVRAGDYAGYGMDGAVAAGILPGERSDYYAHAATVIESKALIGDTGAAFRREFSSFLTEKYKTDGELEKAWRLRGDRHAQY